MSVCAFVCVCVILSVCVCVCVCVCICACLNTHMIFFIQRYIHLCAYITFISVSKEAFYFSRYLSKICISSLFLRAPKYLFHSDFLKYRFIYLFIFLRSLSVLIAIINSIDRVNIIII